MIIPVRYFPPMEYELRLLMNHSITNLPYFILNIINLLMNHSIPNLPISYYMNFVGLSFTPISLLIIYLNNLDIPGCGVGISGYFSDWLIFLYY